MMHGQLSQKRSHFNYIWTMNHIDQSLCADVVIQGQTACTDNYFKLQSVTNNSSTLYCQLKRSYCTNIYNCFIHNLQDSATGTEHCSKEKQFVYMHISVNTQDSLYKICFTCIFLSQSQTSLHILISKIFKMLPCKHGMQQTVKVKEQIKNRIVHINVHSHIF